MWLAIRQALAGPHQESTQWIGCPVVKKIGYIYRDHLYNDYRRLQRRNG
jgi:hypothetical protein